MQASVERELSDAKQLLAKHQQRKETNRPNQARQILLGPKEVESLRELQKLINVKPTSLGSQVSEILYAMAPDSDIEVYKL